VLRGGYRLAFDPPFYAIYLNVATSAPQLLALSLGGFTAANNPVPLPANPTGVAIRALAAPYLTTGVADPRSYNQTGQTPDFGADRVQMWSFGIQRQLGPHAVIESRYVGNHGGRLFQSINGNPRVDQLVSSFPKAVSGVTPCSAASAVVSTAVGRVNCALGIFRERTNAGVSDYEGWQTELRATRLRDQLTLRTAFTWSKTTDNVSEIYNTSGAGNTQSLSQNPLDYVHPEHGLSGLDIPKSWTLSFSEELPFFRKQHKLVGRLLGGWGLAGVYLISSGQPYTPAQAFLAGAAGATWVDTAYNNAFAGYPSINTRPFYSNPGAPVSSVGVYAGDLCTMDGTAGCNLPANTMLSFNAYNQTHAAATTSPGNVRFVVNGATAESIHGTPFGNVGRNVVRDYQTNIANVAVFKYIKINERSRVRFDMTLLNAFNHPNFISVDPFLDDAGLLSYAVGFGIPTLFPGGGGIGQRIVTLGLRIEF
jgi:hypothetical protein